MLRSKPTSPLAALLALSLALALAGCFGGEEDSENAKPDPKPQDTGKTEVKKIKPGLYAGDYNPYDTTRRWESEFTLNADGTYRFYWIIGNEAIGDVKGLWFQKDSALFFHTSGETFINQNTGFFGPHQGIEDDTNSIRDITDTSFTRKEWTLLRQKPYWVTYRKKSFPHLGNGNYAYTREVQVDSTKKITVKIGINLEGTGFLYTYKEDTLESFQASATWYQLGTIFATEGNKGREYVDSLKDFSPWDTIPGALLQRVQSVSDTAFEMWSPGNIFSPGSWDIYRKQ